MTDGKREPRWSVAPYFVVEDVVRAANFYRDTLGFGYERLWGDPPTFCMVHRHGAVIMLRQIEGAGGARPNRLADPKGGAWDAYVWVDDADALRDELTSRGAALVRDVCDQPYGCRDFEVDDCSGYRLCFGQDLGS